MFVYINFVARQGDRDDIAAAFRGQKQSPLPRFLRPRFPPFEDFRPNG
jgi:hypothetical protein